MGKTLDRFLNMMRLNDDSYDDDEYDDEIEAEFEDVYDEEPAYEEEKPSRKAARKPSLRASRRASGGETASFSRPEPQPDDYDDFDAPPADTSRNSGFFSQRAGAGTASRANSKIVPMKSTTVRTNVQEVSIKRPSFFDECSDITDFLLSGKAVIVNLEGLEVAVAQRIIDFVSGSCYALSGNIRKISNYIFVITPRGVDISGDVENVLGDSSTAELPTFHLDV